MIRPHLFFSLLGLCSSLLLAQKTDIPGSKDHPLISRYPGFVITAYSEKAFDDFLLPLGKLIPSGTFVKSQHVQGKVTRIYYDYPEGRSTLEILHNYQDALTKSGFKVLFTCDSEDSCGFGDIRLTADHAERWWSLPRQLTAKASKTTGDIYVSFHVYGNNHGVQLDVVETQSMEGGLVTVDAAAMGSDIADNGHTPVYGILFDTGKADVKPESDAALAEIAKLLQKNSALQLVIVGHTDSVGNMKSNMDLSQKRAEATVRVLVSKYSIAQSRLQSWGDGPTAPVASNKTEQGRAKNRRVELVEQ